MNSHSYFIMCVYKGGTSSQLHLKNIYKTRRLFNIETYINIFYHYVAILSFSSYKSVAQSGDIPTD